MPIESSSSGTLADHTHSTTSQDGGVLSETSTMLGSNVLKTYIDSKGFSYITIGYFAYTINNASTEIFYSGGGMFPSTAGAVGEIALPQACTISSLKVRVTGNTRSSATTVKVQKNGVDTALSVSIPASTNGIFTDSDSFTCVADDIIRVVLSIPMGNNTITIGGILLKVSP